MKQRLVDSQRPGDSVTPMRIPTSVIVMSLVTALPFGLGVREQLKQKDVSAEEFGDDGLDFGSKRSARERRADLEEYEAELRREEAEREAKTKEKLTSMKPSRVAFSMR